LFNGEKEEEVVFYKRAQIFAADLYGAFDGKKWGSFTDMDKLTAFADYKLPQVLRHLEILRYTQALEQKVDREELLDEDTRGSEWSFNVTVEYGSQTLQIAKANVEPQPMKDQIKFWLYTADVTEV